MCKMTSIKLVTGRQGEIKQNDSPLLGGTQRNGNILKHGNNPFFHSSEMDLKIVLFLKFYLMLRPKCAAILDHPHKLLI